MLKPNYKLKSVVQNAISLLPQGFSYSVYYWMQRNFGSLKDSKINPTSRLIAGIETIKRIEQLDMSPIGKTFLEVGTGRRINTILAFWLLGAEKIVTVDLNPYLKEELVRADLNYMFRNKLYIENLFENKIFNNRFDSLIKFLQSPYQLKDLLEFLNIEYIAPGDASSLKLPDSSIDYHTSYTVLEHIPPEVISAIFNEGKRLVKPEGLFVHKIDYSDHFSHSDTSITSINFLQFSEDEWNRLAGNRYMYMNRLRHDDYVNLFTELHLSIFDEEKIVDTKVQKLLGTDSLNINLLPKFSSKSSDILSTTSAWIMLGS